MVNFDDMNRKMTNTEFKSLDRYDNGDIKDLAVAQIFMTEGQRGKVSEDDFSRLDDNDEEMRCLMAEFI